MEVVWIDCLRFPRGEKREWPGATPLGRRAKNRERGLGVKARLLGQQGFLRFPVGRIRLGDFVRADRPALRLIEEPDAFRAPLRVDFIVDIPPADRLVGAFQLAHPAAHALFGNSERHVSLLNEVKSSQRRGYFLPPANSNT
jgi:hypothetical protein